MTVDRYPRPAPPRHRHRPLCGRCPGLALDLGSARTRAFVAGRGMVLDVPTVTFPGAVRPVRRGAVVDTPGAARMLQRLLGHRMPRFGRPLVVVTSPVLDGPAFRAEARTAVEVLRPCAVLTVPGPRAVALAAGADHVRPLLVADIGAHLTEVVLLADGAVTDARRTALGTADLSDGTPPQLITDAVAGMVTAMLRQDRTSLTRTALRRGLLLAGGGALRPDITAGLPDGLNCAVRVVPSPHTAAVRGAAALLPAAHRHPSAFAGHPFAAHGHPFADGDL